MHVCDSLGSYLTISKVAVPFCLLTEMNGSPGQLCRLKSSQVYTLPYSFLPILLLNQNHQGHMDFLSSHHQASWADQNCQFFRVEGHCWRTHSLVWEYSQVMWQGGPGAHLVFFTVPQALIVSWGFTDTFNLKSFTHFPPSGFSKNVALKGHVQTQRSPQTTGIKG